MQSRYIEAAVSGVLIGCLYLPNGNPQPGPKFDYKLKWMERLIARAAELVGARPAGRAGRRLQRHPDRRSTSTSRSAGRTTRCSSPRAARRSSACSSRAGPTRSATSIPKEPIFTFWDYWRNAFARNAGIRIDHLLLNPAAAKRLKAAGVDTRRARAGEGQRPCADLGGAEGALGRPSARATRASGWRSRGPGRTQENRGQAGSRRARASLARASASAASRRLSSLNLRRIISWAACLPGFGVAESRVPRSGGRG